MPQIWTTGPALIFAGISGSAGTPVFVGTCETKPRISVRRAIQEVKNDLGGEKAFELMYSGADAIVTADLNRFSIVAYTAMANAAVAVGGLPPGVLVASGTDSNGATGTLLLTEGQTYQLWIAFPYAAKQFFSVTTAASGGPLMAGYRFAAATLEGPDDIDPGMQPFKVHMVWHCIRTFTPGGTPFGTGDFKLYDFNTSAISGVPIT